MRKKDRVVEAFIKYNPAGLEEKISYHREAEIVTECLEWATTFFEVIVVVRIINTVQWNNPSLTLARDIAVEIFVT